jgi:hypothetical protein
MKTTTPTIKIEVREGSCFPRKVTAGLGDLQACGKTFKEAGARLAELVKAKVEHIEFRYLVACCDGTLLIGYTTPDGHVYAMTGPGRDTSWTCGCGLGKPALVDNMLRHAMSCYGGVLWQKGV